MNWNNYLIEKKSPMADYAHLGVFEDNIYCPFDISELSKDAKIISMSTPLKKFKLKYSNYEALKNNKNIEAICLNDIDEERLSVFETLPNLHYLHISCCKQEIIPNLSRLESLKVLILSSITRAEDFSFISGLKNLQTLYIYGMNKMDDLSFLENMTNLKELFLEHGKMSGTGTAVKSMQPIANLKNLEYLAFILNVQNKNYDVTPLLELKKLKFLRLLPRFYKNKQDILLKEHLSNTSIE